jgi:hypothetical protein
MGITKGCTLVGLAALLSCSDGGIGGTFSDGPGFGSGVGGAFVGGAGDVGFAGGSGAPIFGVGSYDQPLVTAADPPPPLSGGTLLIFDKGLKAAVSDPDHDQIVLVDLEKLAVMFTVALQKGDEPGRAVEDGAGKLHVVLRSGGAIATIDPVAGTVGTRTAVCTYPRGIGYDAAKDVVHVACAGGELVTLSAKDASTTRTLTLARDLRDVVIDGDHVIVSRFRSAELLVLDADGTLVSTIKPPGLNNPVGRSTPAVAWRTIAAPGGGVLMVHQQDLVDEVQIEKPGGYASGGGCGGIVRTAVSLIRRDGTGGTVPVSAPLAIDIAVTSEDAPKVILPAAGLRSSVITRSQASQVAIIAVPAMAPPPAAGGGFADAGFVGAGGGVGFSSCDVQTPTTSNSPGQVVAVATDASNRIVMQTREPYALVVDGGSITLPGDTRMDTGHDLFHLATSAGLACASCHPEGRDDGHIWKFTGLGPRRTQSIGGGILGTEPFHWNGDMADFLSLAHHVFNERMLGPSLQDDYVAALAKWIDKIPPWKTGTGSDAAAVERGKALFNSKAVGCTDCHSGAKLTNNATVDVGTGDKFQVPSLRGVVWRAPFMHDGCAPTLTDRFGSCGGTKHGTVPSDGTAKADLIAYLETL